MSFCDIILSVIPSIRDALSKLKITQSCLHVHKFHFLSLKCATPSEMRNDYLSWSRSAGCRCSRPSASAHTHASQINEVHGWVDREQAENGKVESRTLAAGNFLMILGESDAAKSYGSDALVISQLQAKQFEKLSPWRFSLADASSGSGFYLKRRKSPTI